MSNFANPELTNNFRQIVLASNTPASPAIVFANDLTKGLYWDIDGLHLTGLSATPTDNTEAASKAYVDSQSGGGGVTYPLLAPSGSSPIPYSFTDSNIQGMSYDNGNQQLVLTSTLGSLIINSNGNGIAEATGNGGLFLSANNAGVSQLSLLETGLFTLTSNGSTSGNAILESAGTTSATMELHTKINSIIVGKFDSSSTAGNTRFMLWDVDSGALQRVKVGPAGSGPGGSGRALYLN